jgi:hypothetical protein
MPSLGLCQRWQQQADNVSRPSADRILGSSVAAGQQTRADGSAARAPEQSKTAQTVDPALPTQCTRCFAAVLDHVWVFFFGCEPNFFLSCRRPANSRRWVRCPCPRAKQRRERGGPRCGCALPTQCTRCFAAVLDHVWVFFFGCEPNFYTLPKSTGPSSTLSRSDFGFLSCRRPANSRRWVRCPCPRAKQRRERARAASAVCLCRRLGCANGGNSKPTMSSSGSTMLSSSTKAPQAAKGVTATKGCNRYNPSMAHDGSKGTLGGAVLPTPRSRCLAFLLSRRRAVESRQRLDASHLEFNVQSTSSTKAPQAAKGVTATKGCNRYNPSMAHEPAGPSVPLLPSWAIEGL